MAERRNPSFARRDMVMCAVKDLLHAAGALGRLQLDICLFIRKVLPLSERLFVTT